MTGNEYPDLVAMGYAYPHKDFAEMHVNAGVDRALKEIERDGKSRAQYVIIGVGIYDSDQYVGAMSRTAISVNSIAKTVLFNGTFQHVINGMLSDGPWFKNFVARLKFCATLLFPGLSNLLAIDFFKGAKIRTGKGSFTEEGGWSAVGHPDSRYDSIKTTPRKFSRKESKDGSSPA